MPDALAKFLGSHPAWHVARTRKGFSVRVRTPGRGRRFELITYIPDTTSRGEQLANAIAALPELVRAVSACHDIIGEHKAATAAHYPGARPNECELCAVLQRVTEVQP